MRQRRSTDQAGLGWVLVGVCAILLFLYGAAIVAAPITVPLLFMAGRSSASVAYRVLAGVVAMLTIAEAMSIVTLVSFGEGQPLIWLAPTLAAVAFGLGFVRVSRPSSRRAITAATTWLERRGGYHMLVSSLAAAVVGLGVVLAVRFGRHWAENTPHDCRTFADCSDPFVVRWFALALVVGAASVIAMALSFGRRALLVVPVAFATQGLAMFLVANSDGNWLPLPLDLFIGAACWAAIAFTLGSSCSSRAGVRPRSGSAGGLPAE